MTKRILGLLIVALLLPPTIYLVHLPDTRVLLKKNPDTSAIREFREEQLKKAGKKPRSVMRWRPLSQISPDLAHAVIIAEDDGFYRHNGFDVEQLKNAARTNWERRRFAFGASTITQQLARTLYLSPRKSLLRKAKEALITRRLEKTLPKKRILEIYLNVVEWGPQIYGAEAAAWHFFGKSAADLTSDEAIALAVILPSPRRWNPLKETGFIPRRKAIIRDRMVRAGFLAPEIVPEPAEETGDELSPPDMDDVDSPSGEPATSESPSRAEPAATVP